MNRMIAVIPDMPDHLQKCSRILDVRSITLLINKSRRLAGIHNGFRSVAEEGMQRTHRVMLICYNRKIDSIKGTLVLTKGGLIVLVTKQVLRLGQLFPAGDFLGDATSYEFHLFNCGLFCPQIVQFPELRVAVVSFASRLPGVHQCSTH